MCSLARNGRHFHPFPRLPTELRLRIWALAATPRLVHISVRQTELDRWKRIALNDFSLPMPSPAVMHVCRKSRLCAPYQKAFFTIVPGEPEHRYVWVDFERDMVWLANSQLERLEPYETKIRRLRFTVEPGARGDLMFEAFGGCSHEFMAPFTVLRELHVAISDCFCAWGSTWAGSGYGKCPRENVRFLDLTTGLLLTGPQLEMACEWEWQKGGRVIDMDDFDYELWFMLANYTGSNLPELAKIE
ncbi:hypothetical protein BBK36DRAFT_1110294 [Trichoderma citrinoviride]|uniref:2EXR domain-containing protein n=1 Tax=Trichoderma citrinoviride TaxID=58853 RepID=A0A2T4BL08_9HYPO|nr:hypothetical protein BBK36DRAFT_1110294 [Trichoderma citrinoviride]PTB69950.1 hypothetical protein BBK36DRAFT_1110294 [Trichoderma citrinoviride]